MPVLHYAVWVYCQNYAQVIPVLHYAVWVYCQNYVHVMRMLDLSQALLIK